MSAADLTEEEFAKAFYIKASVRTSIHEMSRVLADFEKRGYKYAFIDEATLMEDFIDAAAIFSDSYAAAGMKIVLSGTDSLGFWFTLDICEIKHTAERSDEQFRHLVDPEKCAVAEKSFGRITSRVVYYRGPDFDHASGVRYRNVENYLSGLKA